MHSTLSRAIAAVTGKNQQQSNYQTISQDDEGAERPPSLSPSELRAKQGRRRRRIKRGTLGAIVVIAVGLFTYGVIL